ncbi:hypothetical protein HDU84_001403 [Entophlyctis sp. JEL0112]|nr:hypothetical protein HDU84_001403 [Entophlyctis sp. JEL0112]
MLPSVPLHPTKALGPRLQPDRQQLQQHSALQYSQFAVCLKSGADTLHVRVPTQLATFLRAIPNLLIISDASDEIEGHVVHDVVTGLYDRKAKASENTAGWRADAHKNIPGFELLYETFPDASWYFMIDDDTYVDFKNLADLVKTLDPDVPYFTGRRNIFAGCDGVKKFGDGPFFVQGGSGILLSRAAMRLVYGGMSACILRYETCWAGDVRTALCMRDAGVLVTLNVGFFGTGLHEEVPYTDDPCIRPFTFHHNNSTAIERLFRLSQTQEGLTMASAHQEFVDTQTTIDVGYDRKGGHFKSIDGLDAVQCQGLCQLEPQCASWVLTDAGLCQLKKTPGFVFAHANFTSGGIAGRYRCLQSQH